VPTGNPLANANRQRMRGHAHGTLTGMCAA